MFYLHSELILSQKQFPTVKTLLWQSFSYPFFKCWVQEERPMILQFLLLCGFCFGGVCVSFFASFNVCSLFLCHNFIYSFLYFMCCENCTSWYISWNDMYWLKDLLTYQLLNNYILRWGYCTRLTCSSKWYSDTCCILLCLCTYLVWRIGN